MKITIIGGSSYSWGPTFLRDIFITPTLKGATVTLHDIDSQRMNLIFRLGQKMLAHVDGGFTLEQTLSLDEALTSADFVILTITTGGLETMRPDLEIPWKYGIRQSVGDTVGPGGVSRALRNIPVVAAIAQKVNTHCPNALFLNYTNPLTVLTRTIDMLRDVHGRTVGLCHEWIGVRQKLAAAFGVTPEQISERVAGINHFIWLMDVYAAGRRVWDELPGLTSKIMSGEMDIDPDDDSMFVDKARVKARLFQLYGALPAAGDRHIAEFMPSILCEATNWGADYGFRLTSVDDRAFLMDIERDFIESALGDEISLEPFMHDHSSEAASSILASVVTGGCYTGIMNLPNTGQIANLPLQSVVETFGIIDPTGAHALIFGELPSAVHALVEGHIRNQEMTIQAALTGNRALALQVLLNDPLSCRLTVDQAQSMLAELLEANRIWLPIFFDQ